MRIKKKELLVISLLITILSITIVVIIYLLAVRNQRSNLTVSDFEFITHNTSIKEIYKNLGDPKIDPCSGVCCPEYELADGSIVNIYSDCVTVISVKVRNKNGDERELLSP